MVALSEDDQQRVFWHTGMTGEGVYFAEDKATALQRMNNIPSNRIKDYVIKLLDQLDDIYECLNPDSLQRFSYKELVSGDLNRSVRRDDPRSIIRDWQRIYDHRVDELCRRLGIANYNDPTQRWRYVQDGGTYIKAIPGPADTSIASSREEFYEHIGGGFGGLW